MFLVNSRLGLFTATLSCSTSELLHTTRVPLLPKLRGDFAEFLSESCLAHLSIFYLPTCGGFRYGYLIISGAKLFLTVWIQLLQVRRLSLSRLTSLRTNGFSYLLLLHAYTLSSIRAQVYPPVSLRPLYNYPIVQEYQPVVHRLRLWALS